jgi:hypothetical protein
MHAFLVQMLQVSAHSHVALQGGVEHDGEVEQPKQPLRIQLLRSKPGSSSSSSRTQCYSTLEIATVEVTSCPGTVSALPLTSPNEEQQQVTASVVG